MKTKLTYIFTILWFSLTVWSANAQSVEQLKKERKQIQKKLEQTSQQIKETKNNEKITLKKIGVIQQGVQERKALINNYNTEINVLDNKINRLSNEKQSLEKELNKLKKDYTRLIQKAQANQNVHSRLLFILSSKNFDESMRRMRYLHEFTSYQKQQGDKIKNIQKQLTLKTDSLGSHKTSKVEAVKQKEVETVKLQKDVKNQKIVLSGLQQKEKNLLTEYQKHQQKVNNINTKIENIIAEELRKAEARRKEEARKKEEERIRKAEETKQLELAKAKKEAERLKAEAKAAGKSAKEIADQEKKSSAEIAKIENKKIEVAPKNSDVDYSQLTKEETLLNGNFERNRGRLPWPVDRGSISGHFGIHPHPILKQVSINNKGTYFLSPTGTSARAVYDGIVSAVSYYPGEGTTVIIQHGNYRTVYGNLSSAYVRQGQKVSAKQAIGKIYSDDETGKTELYFLIYSGIQRLNPESWIAR